MSTNESTTETDTETETETETSIAGTTATDYLDLTLPQPGYEAGQDPSWPELIVQAFDAIDAKVEIRDAEANLSDYAPKTGAKFLATDTGARYIGDGSNWNALPAPGDSSGVSNPLTGNLDADGNNITNVGSIDTGEINNFVYPERYGAVGDGSTDDTQAIKDAVNRASDSEKRALAFTPGNFYYITDTITIDVQQIRLVEGNNAAIVLDSDITAIEFTSDRTDSFSSTTDSGSNQTLKDEEFAPTIRDLQIYSTTDPYAGTGINVSKTFGAKIEGCNLFSLDTPIQVSGDNRNLNITDNHLWDNGSRSILFDGTVNIHQCNIGQNHIQAATRLISIEQGEVADLQIVGNDLELLGSGSTTQEYAIFADGTGTNLLENVVSGNTIEDHTAGTNLIRLLNTEQWSITDNQLNNAVDAAVHLDGVENVDVKDNKAVSGNNHFVEIASGSTPNRVVVQNNTVVDYSGWVVYHRGDATSQLRVDGNTADNVGGLVDADLGGFITNSSVRNNSVNFLEAPVIRVDTYSTSGNMRTLGVEGNELYTHPDVVSSTNPIVDIQAGEISELQLNNNTAYGRSNGFDGYNVTTDTPELLVMTQNTARDVGGTDFSLPAASAGNVVNEHNIGN